MGKGKIEGCGANFAKYTLFMFNLIFFIFGAALLGIGIWMKVDDSFDKYLDIVRIDGSDKTINAAMILVIVIGAFIFLTGFLGCCGACTENSMLLMVFAILMIILLVAEVVAVILAAVFRKDLGSKLEDSMVKQAKEKVEPLKENDNTPITLSWSFLQKELKCCGGKGYKDYKDNAKFTTQPIPQSCCTNFHSDPNKPMSEDELNSCMSDASADKTSSSEFYADGCYDELQSWVREKAAILIGIAVAIAIIQILGIIFACCVRNAIGKGEFV